MTAIDTNLHSDISAWLVSNIKQSSSTTQLTFRSFCLSTLNQIYTQNRKYTELFHFLSSLIDDPSYAFRAQVAKCLGLYGFNYKFCSRRHARHTYDNTCSFHNPKKQNYPIELLSPYTVLLNYFDSILGSSRYDGIICLIEVRT